MWHNKWNIRLLTTYCLHHCCHPLCFSYTMYIAFRGSEVNGAGCTCYVGKLFGCVNSLPLACWTSHVAFPLGFRFFPCKVSAGGILQVLVTGSRFLYKNHSSLPHFLRAFPYGIAFASFGDATKEMGYSMIFAGNSLHLHTFSLSTSEAM